MPSLLRRSALCLVFLLVWNGEIHAQVLRVTRVVDGDTYDISDGRRVRLIGIDTPEKYVTGKLRRDARRTGRDIATIRARGRAASRYAKQLVLGRRVELSFDPANAPDHQGRYGRTLAYVWVLDEGGHRLYMINRRLVRDGYAKAYTSYPFQYMSEFLVLQRQARATERGLWGYMDIPADRQHQERQATPRGKYDPSGPDRDCSDFSSNAAAQAFLEAAGAGDPHRLDGDGDGQACESL